MPGSHSDFHSTTDFAITSVNVPDRLDQREVDDRKQQDDAFYARRGLGSTLRVWLRRLLPYAVLLAIVVLVGDWLAGERQTWTAEHVSQRLSSAFQVPVQVQDTRLRTAPAPAIVLLGIDLGGRMRLDEVALEFTAPSLWQAVMSGRRRWGDVVVSPTKLTFEQADQLLTWLSSVDRAVPDTVNKIRFAELRFAGSGLLPDRYEAVTRREPGGQFKTVLLRRLDTSGSMQIQVTPDRSGGPIAFQCDAAGWQPPFVPNTSWSELVASGHLGGGAIQIEQFTLGSAFGAVEGQLSVRKQDRGPAWAASGRVSSVGIDIATVIQQALKLPEPADPTAPPATAMSGTASVEALLSGSGATPEDALGHLVAAGEIKVRGATLNGINLGYAATRPSTGTSSSAASTRFTRFDASFTVAAGGIQFKDIHGQAGALSTRGELAVAPDLGLNGLIHVDLGGTRIQAPLRLHVRGTVAHPQFGR